MSKKITPYFSDKDIPDSKNEYVCWIDMMGTKLKMVDTMQKATIHVFKFHAALIKYKTADVTLYPVMDGAYITSSSLSDLLLYLQSIFFCLGQTMIESDPSKAFLIRAGIAYGPILHGHDVPRKASFELDDHHEIRDQILIGPPMSQAYQIESQAPPFGIYIHDSIRLYVLRNNNPPNHIEKWWKWWEGWQHAFCSLIDFSDLGIDTYMGNLKAAIKKYFVYAMNNSNLLSYDKTDILRHTEQFDEYLR